MVFWCVVLSVAVVVLFIWYISLDDLYTKLLNEHRELRDQFEAQRKKMAKALKGGDDE